MCVGGVAGNLCSLDGGKDNTHPGMAPQLIPWDPFIRPAISIGQIQLHCGFADYLTLFLKYLGFDKTEKIFAKPLSPSFLSPCGF